MAILASRSTHVPVHPNPEGGLIGARPSSNHLTTCHHAIWATHQNIFSLNSIKSPCLSVSPKKKKMAPWWTEDSTLLAFPLNLDQSYLKGWMGCWSKGGGRTWYSLTANVQMKKEELGFGGRKDRRSEQAGSWIGTSENYHLKYQSEKALNVTLTCLINLRVFITFDLASTHGKL